MDSVFENVNNFFFRFALFVGAEEQTCIILECIVGIVEEIKAVTPIAALNSELERFA